MDIEIREFITYLHNRKRTSHNTEVSYQRDLKKMAAYFEERGIYDIKDVGELELEGYLSYMERGQFASSTISRNVASIRALFQYLHQEGRIEKDPSLELKPPKVEKRMPEILTVDEVDRLLKQPDLNTPKGIRDSAMLELLYATGMRVSELLRLNLEDLNLRLGYVVCHDEDKERVIPIGNVCKTAMEKYLKEARGKFVKENETESLFTNCFQCSRILIEIKGLAFSDFFINSMKLSCIPAKQISYSQKHIRHFRGSRILKTIFQIFKAHVFYKIPHFLCISRGIHRYPVQLIQHLFISHKRIYDSGTVIHLIHTGRFQ